MTVRRVIPETDKAEKIRHRACTQECHISGQTRPCSAISKRRSFQRFSAWDSLLTRSIFIVSACSELSAILATCRLLFRTSPPKQFGRQIDRKYPVNIYPKNIHVNNLCCPRASNSSPPKENNVASVSSGVARTSNVARCPGERSPSLEARAPSCKFFAFLGTAGVYDVYVRQQSTGKSEPKH